MKTLFLLYSLLITTFSYAQSLEQAVIGAAGNFSSTSGGSSLSWTIGEPISSTESSNSAILTQGFQQPVTVNPLSTNKDLGSEIFIQVYPNPTTQQITVKTNNTGHLKADLINILGQTIHSYSLDNQTSTINLEALPAANYLLQVYNTNNRSFQTFKIQKIQ